MSQRIDSAFAQKKDILNVYFTAGFPTLDDTVRIAKALEVAGADMLEIGIPFSDPVADGPVIQRSSEQALENGMSLVCLFEQLRELRKHVSIPVLLMGYINPVLQYGIEQFCDACVEVGIDGVIIPDLPMHEYVSDYQRYFDERGIANIFLVSPNTSKERVRYIDEQTRGFIYVVSSAGTTGAKNTVQDGQQQYFQRIQSMALNNPTLIGFGISNRETFANACTFADGAIIGSAFIQQLNVDASNEAIAEFVQAIK